MTTNRRGSNTSPRHRPAQNWTSYCATTSCPAQPTDQLRQELDKKLEHAEEQVAALYGKDNSRILPELQMAKVKLIAAEKSAIEQAVHDGLISQPTANKMIEAEDRELDELTDEGE